VEGRKREEKTRGRKERKKECLPSMSSSFPFVLVSTPQFDTHSALMSMFIEGEGAGVRAEARVD
jgi:hypothetical protein